jgi:hypothetical protein
LRSKNQGISSPVQGVEGGLGEFEEILRKPLQKRRKYLISISQRQANSKFKDGKKHSLYGALREPALVKEPS